MKFRKGTDDLKKFLNDIPYFDNENNFCLGNSLSEAGEIIRVIMTHKGEEKKAECGNG